MESKHYTAALATAAVVTVALICAGALGAQQPPAPASNTSPAAPAGNMPPGAPAQPGAAPAAPAAPPKPLMPVAASSIGMHPDKYYGEVVTLFGTVDATLSPTAFSVDQDKAKSTGKEVLVVAPRMHEPIELNSYVTVIGEVVRADATEIAKKMKAGAAGLPPEILAKYPGRPVIIATSVINAALTDLARFLPPPMTPEEAEFDKVMKGVAAANGALRKGVDASNAELVKTSTAILTKGFADTEAFWKARGKGDAVKIAGEARKATDLLAAAAAKNNWGDVKLHAATLTQQCASCHGVYRERGEDGSFFIKPVSK